MREDGLAPSFLSREQVTRLLDTDAVIASQRAAFTADGDAGPGIAVKAVDSADEAVAGCRWSPPAR
ncbi:hypothetical protein [Streptomyces rhizosphaerihabitans]|uniref:hypothetical protein n=1 Tax=Streptomyces rhizosphaerihabitans TaxID=1266770 RepID=UPI0021BF93D7|nr:hypothetical protein [Streptomyces rhizosphaerihabitans]MCT9008435.1 hypothetical protein [Streptomyces rhizosphaerihabitans]